MTYHFVVNTTASRVKHSSPYICVVMVSETGAKNV